MLFFYIRHGDPIYTPDSLTELGKKQANALAKRLSVYGIDKVYSSPSARARQTAKPTCDWLKKEMIICEWANESPEPQRPDARRHHRQADRRGPRILYVIPM